MTTTGRPTPLPQDPSPATADTPQPVTVTDLAIGLPDGPPLLQRTSLGLRTGRITALTGPSGSGKTTLLRALIGDLPQGRGSPPVPSRSSARTSSPSRPTPCAPCAATASLTSDRTPARPSTPG